MADIRAERLAACPDEEFVLFVIGLRVNKPWKVHKWWPVSRAMGRMLDELSADPESAGLRGRSHVQCRPRAAHGGLRTAIARAVVGPDL
jgi:hypothetical protein